MTTMGCCGYGPRRVSIAGLLADADFHPANTPQGRRARARLAYSVAAAQAARTNNPSAYRRALSGLANLGDEITSTDSSAAAQGINGALQRLGTNASFRNSLSQASAYIGLALNAASLGTGIAATACNGCDRTGIDVVNNVISWIRALMNGSVPSVSGLTPEQLNGFVDFCAVKDQIKGAVQIAFTAASAAANAAAAGGTAGAAQAATALDTIQSFVGSFLDSICQIPQVQTAIANRAAAAAAAAAPPPPPAQPAQPATSSTRCWDGSTQTAPAPVRRAPPRRSSGRSTSVRVALEGRARTRRTRPTGCASRPRSSLHAQRARARSAAGRTSSSLPAFRTRRATRGSRLRGAGRRGPAARAAAVGARAPVRAS